MNDVSKLDVRDKKTGRLLKGHAMPKTWRDKISQATKGEKNPFFNKKHTLETRAKIKEARARQDMSLRKGKIHSEYTKQRIRNTKALNPINGDKHPMWGGGCLLWLKAQVRKRDNFTCAVCQYRDEYIMEVDHIIPKSVAPELVNETTNLQTLCPNCHRRKTLRERAEGVYGNKK